MRCEEASFSIEHVIKLACRDFFLGHVLSCTSIVSEIWLRTVLCSIFVARAASWLDRWSTYYSNNLQK